MLRLKVASFVVTEHNIAPALLFAEIMEDTILHKHRTTGFLCYRIALMVSSVQIIHKTGHNKLCINLIKLKNAFGSQYTETTCSSGVMTSAREIALSSMRSRCNLKHLTTVQYTVCLSSIQTSKHIAHVVHCKTVLMRPVMSV